MKSCGSCALIFGVILCAAATAHAEAIEDMLDFDFEGNFLPVPNFLNKDMRQIAIALNTAVINETLEKNFPNVSLVLVSRANVTQTVSFSLSEINRIPTHRWFNQALPTVIYCYGFTEHSASLSIGIVIAAYAKQAFHNILFVDWSSYNGKKAPNDYPAAIENMKSIGMLIGARLFNAFGILQLVRFHIVGLSLGAHMAAYINRGIPTSFPYAKIPKIIGLDPAGPLMYDAALNHKPLNAADAIIVQVIHTDMRGAGTSVRSGTVDFYPNGGGINGVQPGCPAFDLTNIFKLENFCSHFMSAIFYAESVIRISLDTFQAVSCPSYADFTSSKCQFLILDQMGFASKKVGEFYLQTNSKLPYSRGFAGTIYSLSAS